VGPNGRRVGFCGRVRWFQSSVRINVGPNDMLRQIEDPIKQFQSSVRINVGPNFSGGKACPAQGIVSILRED